ncbi:MAG TPA: DUF3592 domain-containing protein [Acidobacteriaceae bacterium]|jgi:hypothetical protein|nr:DUF3592 domain-containing protein [Acidobacteriaceae bacterium]
MTADFSISWHNLLRFFHVWIYALKWPLAFVAGWASIYVRRWQKSRREEAAQSWPLVEGNIAGAKVEIITHTSRYVAKLQYTYFVEEYRLGEYTHEFSKKTEADNFAAKMKGQRVQIRYKQSNPAKSVLEQSVVEQHILLTPRFG